MKVSEILAEKSHIESLSLLCKLFGNQLGTYDANCLSTEFMNVIVNGRDIADEYEDLPSEAPCKVDYIAVNNDSNNLWFHMYSNFSTSFPLASNDRYNIGCIGESHIKSIYDFYHRKYRDEDIDKEKLTEIKRSEWIKISGNLTFIEIFKTDIRHLIDCTYCCYGSESKVKKDGEFISFSNYCKAEDFMLSLKEYGKTNDGVIVEDDCIKITEDAFIELLLESITQTVALGIRITWPTYQDFKNSGYLAYQTTIRYIRWKKITPKVYKKVLELCDDTKLSETLLLYPAEVIKDLVVNH